MEATFLETKPLKSVHVSQHKDATLADFTRSQRLRQHAVRIVSNYPDTCLRSQRLR